MINWKISAEDEILIDSIVARAVNKHEINILELNMDLTACHANGCPLRLKELLEADEFNFWHDIFGIRNRMDRTTGKLSNHFLPRYAVGD
jgi:hypothetical protein